MAGDFAERTDGFDKPSRDRERLSPTSIDLSRRSDERAASSDRFFPYRDGFSASFDERSRDRARFSADCARCAGHSARAHRDPRRAVDTVPGVPGNAFFPPATSIQCPGTAIFFPATSTFLTVADFLLTTSSDQ
jgi:hypothetical protein